VLEQMVAWMGIHFLVQTPASAERFGAADFRRGFIVEVLSVLAKAVPSRESVVTTMLPHRYVQAA
jgi:hypothetical protein